MWDERYREPGFAYGVEPNDFLVEQADRLTGRVLCLAEGEGRNAVFLARRGIEVLAVDQSAVGLEKAAALASTQGVTLRTEVADLAHYAIPPRSWDGVVSIWAHLPPELRRRVHAAVVEGLVPGGVLVLEAYTPANIGRDTGGPPVAAMCMTAADLRDELTGLEWVVLEETERHVAEGKYHRGWSAVVRAVGVKPH